MKRGIASQGPSIALMPASFFGRTGAIKRMRSMDGANAIILIAPGVSTVTDRKINLIARQFKKSGKRVRILSMSASMGKDRSFCTE